MMRFMLPSSTVRLLRPVAGLSLLLLALLAASCGGGSGPESVSVELTEWQISVAPANADRGRLELEARNTGARTHQLLVVKSDALPGDLPLADGKVDESKLNVAQRAQPLPPGSSQVLTLTLSAGKYLFICNQAEQVGGAVESHYLNGMVAAFIVGE